MIKMIKRAKKAFQKVYCHGVEVEPLNLFTIISWLFLGSRNLNSLNEDQSVVNLIKNFVGWQDDATKKRKILNVILMPIIIPLNILALLLNIAKIFTEFLPAMLGEIFSKLFNEIEILSKFFPESKSSSYVTEGNTKIPRAVAVILKVLGILITFSLAVVFVYAYLVGQSITSPITSVKNAWDELKDAEQMIQKLGKVSLLALNILITFIVYAIFFPLAAKFILAEVIPFVASHLPVVIFNAISLSSQAIAPILTVIGNAIMPIVSYVGSTLFFLSSATLTSAMSTAPALAGLGAIVAIFITTGTVISKLRDSLRSWWDKEHKKHNSAPPPAPANAELSAPRLSSQGYPNITAQLEENNDNLNASSEHVAPSSNLLPNATSFSAPINPQPGNSPSNQQPQIPVEMPDGFTPLIKAAI
jgi:hypothetical protein